MSSARQLAIGLLVLGLFDVAGELTVHLLHVPFPGPVVGMLFYLGALVVRGQPSQGGLEAQTQKGATLLLRNMSLFFVPAGVGIVTQVEVIRREWPPLVAAIVLSTFIALVAGGLAFTFVARGAEARRAALEKTP